MYFTVEDQGGKYGKSSEVDTVEKIDDFEEKIDKCLDGLLEKGLVDLCILRGMDFRELKCFLKV